MCDSVCLCTHTWILHLFPECAHTGLDFVLSSSSWNVCLGCVNIHAHTNKHSKNCTVSRQQQSITAWPSYTLWKIRERKEWGQPRKENNSILFRQHQLIYHVWSDKASWSADGSVHRKVKPSPVEEKKVDESSGLGRQDTEWGVGCRDSS